MTAPQAPATPPVTVPVATVAIPVVATPTRIRVRVFIDYWNFQLSLNEREAKVRGLDDYRFQIEWKKVGPWLAKKACGILGCDPAAHSFEGVTIYTSYAPGTTQGAKFRNWVNTWLDRQPGVQVSLRERKPRGHLKCPECHLPVTVCPNAGCGKPIKSTVEKGVDTLIATDMVRLAWENAYDVAVLATSDSDLVPAVEFLGLKGLKVIQAGFPPIGIDLATACWGSFDVFKDRAEIERPPAAGP